MTRKRNLIDLKKLNRESTQLRTMVAELCIEKPALEDLSNPRQWGRRFAASGKNQCHFMNPDLFSR